MENHNRKNAGAVRERLLLYPVAVAGNLLPFALSASFFGGHIGNAVAALVFGAGMTVVGIVLSFLFRAKWEEKRIPWLISVCCLGLAKGGCAAALMLKLSMAPADGFVGCLRSALLAAGIAFGADVLFAAAVSIRPTATASQVLAIALPLAAVATAIVLLACVGGGFFLLLLLNVLTGAFCSALFLQTFNDSAEARFILSVASMLYATLLLFVALFVVSEGECCDSADCDCPCECMEHGKKKK